MRKLLVFHSALAPYRVDFFNMIADNFSSKVLFLSKNNRNQKFNQDNLLSELKINYGYLDKKIEYKGRDINLGYFYHIRNESPDIIIGGEFGLPVIIPFLYRFLFRGKYKIYTICDDSLSIAKECSGIRKILRDFIVPRLDGLIVLSDYVSDWYMNQFNLSKKPIVFSLIRNDLIYRQKLEKSLTVVNHHLSTYYLAKKKVFLFVGRLEKVKNLEVLIKVFSNIAKEDFRLVLVGDGSDRGTLEELVSNLPNSDKIIFAGRYEGVDLAAWYILADLFILPSIYEPFGAVVNEALLAGCPVLCSETAGAASLINNQNGELFNPTSLMDLEIKLKSCISKLLKYENKSFSNLRPSLMQFKFSDQALEFVKQINI